MFIILMIIAIAICGLQVIILWRLPSGNGGRFGAALAALEKGQERAELLVREEMNRNRDGTRKELEALRAALSGQVISLTQMNEQKLERVRDVVDLGLKSLQEDNSRKLELMRQTVDEKLHTTLEKRLAESFRSVGEQLEKVHKGLGEMQNLAVGVGDLKRVLSNVKTRGILGEVQLGNLLENILASDQYERNVMLKPNSRDAVDFALKFPAKDGQVLWLPVDAKFPTEDYVRMQEAQELGDPVAVEEAAKALERQIKVEAKTIRDKYIDPPRTTDFGIMFLPTEGLYAEVLRRPGLFESLQYDYRITAVGPTTICAFLNSLQMVFRNIAIGKRADEVVQLLRTIKGEFGKFEEILQRVHDKIQEAGNIVDDAASKTRNITKKLQKVELLPGAPDSPQPTADSGPQTGDGAIGTAGSGPKRVDAGREDGG
ncbi:MAG: DNA recombination protein RmuC [Candidatus Omnitrophica bacterium]|nr:DNA recombination protein RmuC [Candidatus Omnitrophota bacterium]